MRVVTLARKPLVGSVVENVVEHGVGGFNVDASRTEKGRYPHNVILQGCDVVEALDRQSGERPSTLTGRADPSRAHHRDYGIDPRNRSEGWGASIQLKASALYADSGGASRFFKQVGVSEQEV